MKDKPYYFHNADILESLTFTGKKPYMFQEELDLVRITNSFLLPSSPIRSEKTINSRIHTQINGQKQHNEHYWIYPISLLVRRIVMLTFSLNIKATPEVLMKMQESHYPSKNVASMRTNKTKFLRILLCLRQHQKGASIMNWSLKAILVNIRLLM